MLKLISSLILFFLYSSLLSCQTKTNQAIRTSQQIELNQFTQEKIADLRSYYGIKILDEGPAGRRHFNDKRGEFGCTKFRITIYNDTLIPIQFKLRFPAEPVSSLPEPLIQNQCWILPDSLAPDTFQNGLDFGVTGIENHFNADFTDPGYISTTIQPKDHYSFYVAGMGKGPFDRGSSYSKLFINGQPIDVPYLQGRSFKIDIVDTNSLDLIWGIGHTPHKLYTIIPCGTIKFLE